MPDAFKAILVSRDENKKQSVEIVEMQEADLMEGDVVVAVEATTVNYKDGLALTGKAPVIRRWPMIRGIDLAGTVIRSEHPAWQPGDKVILNGWGVGETHFGAYAGKARLKGDWLVPLPEGMTPAQAMAIGTAGYTAMLCVMALQRYGIQPSSGPVVITGAAGGVGSIAIAIMARLGFEIVAVTGRVSEEAWLKNLGAKEILAREELTGPVRPLAGERWAAGIDVAGSTVLANLLSMIRYGGAVAACGLAGGMDLPSSVAPFILRGVSLLGVDSVMAPKPLRIEAWNRLDRELDRALLDSLTEKLGFEDIPEAGNRILAGQIRGRVVIEM